MMDVFTSLSLLGYCLLIRRFLRWPIEAAPLFLFSATIVLFYLFAYFHFLPAGSLWFIIFGGIALIISPLYLPHQRNNLLNYYFTPSLCIFIFYILVFGIVAHYLVVTDWDELSRWLPHAKFLYWHHGFWQAADSTPNKDYPPGSALFYYLFLRLSDFSDGRLFFGQLLLTLSPLIILLRKYRWSQWSKAFIIFSLLLVLLIFLFHLKIGPNGTLYMDEVTGLFFGGMLVSYYVMEKERGLWFYLIIPAMALMLFKQMLLPFVAIISVIIFCDQLFLIMKKQAKIFVLPLFSGIILFPLLVLISWQAYVQTKLGMIIQWHLFNSLSTIRNKSMVLNETQFHSVFPQYLHALIAPLIFMLIMWVIILSINYLITNHITKYRLWIAHIILSVGFIIYLGLLLLIYFYQMPVGIVLQMNSFGRFINIYEIGWMLVVVSHVLYFVDRPLLISRFNLSKKLSYAVLTSLVVFLGAYTIFYSYSTYQNFVERKDSEYIRYAINQQLTEPLRGLIGEKGRIAFMWQGWGLITFMVSYDLLPRVTDVMPIYSGPTKDFIYLIRPENYVIIGGNISEDFWQKYKDYFVTSPQKQFPFVKLALCTDANFDNADNSSCSLHQVPIYLYKVVMTRGRLQLMSVHSTAVSF